MKRPEQALQKAVCLYLDRQYPDLLYWHTPNGGGRSKVEGAIFKSLGVKAGIPDLFFVWSDAAFNHCAAIELKTDKGKLTPSQISMHARLESCGVPVSVCRSIEDVQAAIEEWGIRKNRRSKQVEW